MVGLSALLVGNQRLPIFLYFLKSIYLVVVRYGIPTKRKIVPLTLVLDCSNELERTKMSINQFLLILPLAQTLERGDGLHPTDKSVGIRPTIL